MSTISGYGGSFNNYNYYRSSSSASGAGSSSGAGGSSGVGGSSGALGVSGSDIEKQQSLHEKLLELEKQLHEAVWQKNASDLRLSSFKRNIEYGKLTNNPDFVKSAEEQLKAEKEVNKGLANKIKEINKAMEDVKRQINEIQDKDLDRYR